MNGFEMNTADAAAIAGNLDSQQASLEDEMRHVHLLTEQLMLEWIGQTSRAYERAEVVWNEGMRKMHEGLMAVTTLLRRNADNYEESDASTARVFSH